MDYAILPFKTAKFLRLLRKAQIDQSRMVSYDGFFVISTFRIGNQPVKDINVEKYSKSIRHLQHQRQSFCLLQYQYGL